MKVEQKDLIKNIPASVMPDKLPAWMIKADEIVKGINTMVDTYKEMTGKGNPVVEATVTEPAEKLDFSTARALKKAEMETKRKPLQIEGERVVTMPDEFKELLDGAIKTLAFYSAQGAGAQQLGAAIMALPVTVDQILKFLSDLRIKKYG